MEIRYQVGGPSKWKADAVLQFVFSGEGPEEACSALMQAAPWLGIAPAWRDFRGGKDECVMMYGPAAMDISRALCVGLGDPAALDLMSFRHAVGRAVRRCRSCGLESIGLDAVSLARVAERLGVAAAALVREAVVSAGLALYRYDRWKSDAGAEKDPRWMAVMADDEFISNDVRDAARMAEAEAAGVCLARDLANDPACALTPSDFAAKACGTAARHGMKATVFGRDDLAAEGMNAYLAVAKGSVEEPRMGLIEYTLFAQTIDDRFTCVCESCHPEVTDPTCACRWRFVLA
ncbi:MAG: DUF6125 family protein [Mailhella sp.]|nr:DUF6125 family protein [Mailhella sp.]